VAATAESVCQECVAGKYAPNSGNDDDEDCIDCAAGKYYEDPEQCENPCLDCAVGKYSETLGNDDERYCRLCPKNTFSSLLGANISSDCLDCDVHASSDAGSDSQQDCICNAGYVGNDVDVCVICPKGYWCPGGKIQFQCPNHSSSIPGSSNLNECECEPGWYGGPVMNKACSSLCSDGIRVQGEECDDGNQLGNDGCSSICEIEPGWNCKRASPLDADRCSTTCGKTWLQCVSVYYDDRVKLFSRSLLCF